MIQYILSAVSVDYNLVIYDCDYIVFALYMRYMYGPLRFCNEERQERRDSVLDIIYITLMNPPTHIRCMYSPSEDGREERQECRGIYIYYS